jgi:hypothetical protein
MTNDLEAVVLRANVIDNHGPTASADGICLICRANHIPYHADPDDSGSSILTAYEQHQSQNQESLAINFRPAAHCAYVHKNLPLSQPGRSGHKSTLNRGEKSATVKQFLSCSPIPSTHLRCSASDSALERFDTVPQY